MVKIVGIKFSKKSRLYYFDSVNFELKKNMEVIVGTEKGLQYGFVVKETKEIEERKLDIPLKEVIRLASKNDKLAYEKNIEDSNKALEKARQLADELQLDMHIIDANYTFDRKQLLFNFTSDDRVDFRDFAKRLAGIYRTRIELRQIGIRDKAREVGGLGPCGRFLCCNSFLTDINSVTINMAKNQSLALNPAKINGVCGRLLCCLGYEDDIYTELRKDLPSVGSKYKYNDILYRVVDVDIFTRRIRIESPEHTIEEIYIPDGNC